ncbi:MAG: hypothetical protein IJ515_06165 [Clostridia bacterium]|nr:hypothetical protein [Clostridia bacterium]
MEKRCSLCKRIVDSETAEILAMGGFGDPKYICDECAADIETATTSHEFEEIKSAMSRISDKMANNDIINRTTLSAIEEIFTDAKERAQRIKDGTYDFSEDEASVPEESLEVPEELRESDEDRALDEKENKPHKTLNLIIDIVAAAVLVASITFFVLWIL